MELGGLRELGRSQLRGSILHMSFYNGMGSIMTNILTIRVTDNDFIFDFGDFRIETSKDYIDDIDKLEWFDGCLMIYVKGDIESIGLEHLLFGEPPLYIPCDYELIGKDTITRDELQKYISNIEEVRYIV